MVKLVLCFILIFFSHAFHAPLVTNRRRTQLSAIRYLGKGENAIVRAGTVLVAPTHEYHHFYRHAAIFIYDLGELPDGEYVIRGLILDHPTPFTLGEMMEEDSITSNPLSRNLIFRGGDAGGDGVILLHRLDNLGQDEIGTSGIYQGGWEAALDACAQGKAKPEDFKVFFNYCEFTETTLEQMLDADAEGDAWISVEIDRELVLSSDYDRGGCWSRLRNAVMKQLNE